MEDAIAKAWDAVQHVDSPEAEALRSVFGTAIFRIVDNAGIRPHIMRDGESSTLRDQDVAQAIIDRLAAAYLYAKSTPPELRERTGAEEIRALRARVADLEDQINERDMAALERSRSD